MNVQQNTGVKMSLFYNNQKKIFGLALILVLTYLVILAHVADSRQVRDNDRTITRHVDDDGRILVKRGTSYNKKKGTYTSTTKQPSEPDKTTTSTTSKPDNSGENSSTKGPTNPPPLALDRARMEWLKRQEMISLNYMVAGIINWGKILNETRGVPFNRKFAGEFFHSLDKKVTSKLSADNRPEELAKFYMDEV